jgi:hypothetical protein
MKAERPLRGYLPHFCQRARERGISSVAPEVLWRALHEALKTGSDAVEHVMDTGGTDEGTIWRFRLPVEGVFYFIARGQVPVTVITQAMVRDYKLARKACASPRRWKEAQAIAAEREVQREKQATRIRKRTEPRWK